MKTRMKLLWLVIKGTISFKYWWNYDYSPQWIIVMGRDVNDDANHKLCFNEQLMLVSEDEYRIIDTNNWLVGKYINSPINGSAYRYDELSHVFDLIL